MSVTQFIWKTALGMSEFEPPLPKGRRGKYGADSSCWLCAGETEGKGWHIKDVIGSAFTDTASAKSPSSQTVCYSCAALLKKEAWEQACNKYDYFPYFPVKEGKKPFMSSWMFASHVFSDGVWLMPSRQEMRGHLLEPPNPPFVISVSDMGKIHVLFRCEVSLSNDDFFVNLDTETIRVNRAIFAKILSDVEDGYIDFSKESMLTGEYNQAAIMRTGLKRWREVESVIKKHRSENNGMLKLAVFVSIKKELLQ